MRAWEFKSRITYKFESTRSYTYKVIEYIYEVMYLEKQLLPTLCSFNFICTTDQIMYLRNEWEFSRISTV